MLADNRSSSGLLIYGALVDLLAEDFLSEDAQHFMSSKKKAAAFFWVLAGCKPNRIYSLTIVYANILP